MKVRLDSAGSRQGQSAGSCATALGSIHSAGRLQAALSPLSSRVARRNRSLPQLTDGVQLLLYATSHKNVLLSLYLSKYTPYQKIITVKVLGLIAR
jgi:hypothetical protein